MTLTAPPPALTALLTTGRYHLHASRDLRFEVHSWLEALGTARWPNPSFYLASPDRALPVSMCPIGAVRFRADGGVDMELHPGAGRPVVWMSDPPIMPPPGLAKLGEPTEPVEPPEPVDETNPRTAALAVIQAALDSGLVDEVAVESLIEAARVFRRLLGRRENNRDELVDVIATGVTSPGMIRTDMLIACAGLLTPPPEQTT